MSGNKESTDRAQDNSGSKRVRVVELNSPGLSPVLGPVRAEAEALSAEPSESTGAEFSFEWSQNSSDLRALNEAVDQVTYEDLSQEGSVHNENEAENTSAIEGDEDLSQERPVVVNYEDQSQENLQLSDQSNSSNCQRLNEAMNFESENCFMYWCKQLQIPLPAKHVHWQRFKKES